VDNVAIMDLRSDVVLKMAVVDYKYTVAAKFEYVN
jgi:hypothetical protein